MLQLLTHQGRFSQSLLLNIAKPSILQWSVKWKGWILVHSLPFSCVVCLRGLCTDRCLVYLRFVSVRHQQALQWVHDVPSRNKDSEGIPCFVGDFSALLPWSRCTENSRKDWISLSEHKLLQVYFPRRENSSEGDGMKTQKLKKRAHNHLPLPLPHTGLFLSVPLPHPALPWLTSALSCTLWCPRVRPCQQRALLCSPLHLPIVPHLECNVKRYYPPPAPLPRTSRSMWHMVCVQQAVNKQAKQFYQLSLQVLLYYLKHGTFSTRFASFLPAQNRARGENHAEKTLSWCQSKGKASRLLRHSVIQCVREKS